MSDAKQWARADFCHRKRIAKAGPAKGWTRPEVRPWLHAMRNAWVAYHHGEPWMVAATWGSTRAHAAEVERGRARVEAQRLRAEVRRADAREKADRLITEDTERALSDMCAEVKRLRGVCREAAQRLRSLSSAPNHGPKSVLDHVADLERDALTREDGEG